MVVLSMSLPWYVILFNKLNVYITYNDLSLYLKSNVFFFNPMKDHMSPEEV